MPAIHITQEEVGHLFEKELGSEKGNYDPTYLTYCARMSLRDEFMTAQAGMTGANFGVAATGDIVVCTSEDNPLRPLHLISEKHVQTARCISFSLTTDVATSSPTKSTGRH